MSRALHDLVHGVRWDEVEAALLRLYPGEAEEVDRFRQAYERLAALTPAPSAFVIRFEWCTDELEEWLSVSGEDGTLRDDGEPEGFALELTPWSEWLGMAVGEEVLREYGEADIVAHCLFEMTAVGFDEETIRAQLEEIERRVRRWKRMTPEERAASSSTWEEVRARLEERLRFRPREGS